ncbi:MAG: DNA repair protein RadC [Ruminococcaceae bacterium]|nr:DNA repair protein RadC [Oscillospiraceae bacterium]
MNLHEGHRQRLKERFLKDGLAGFEDHNILELLLFYSVPRADTNETGHKLLNKFGSLSKVFEASVEELCEVDGIGIHSATLIKLIPEIYNAYNVDKTKNITVLNTHDDLGKYFIPRFLGKKDEEVHMVLLDSKNKIIKSENIAKGSVNAVQLSVRYIISQAINNNATGVILAHNHPAGVALPSTNDIKMTKKLFEALRLADIKLKDHIIVAEDDFVSLRDSGCFAEYEY